MTCRRLLIVAFMLPLAVSAATEVELQSTYDGDSTKAYSYVVTKRILERQPLWTPGDPQPCPLSIENATHIALKWLANQPWGKTVLIRNISLSRNFFYGIKTSFYIFGLSDRVLDESPSPGGISRASHPYVIIVLLDGSFVKAKNVRSQGEKWQAFPIRK